jgi:hypothetical protein
LAACGLALFGLLFVVLSLSLHVVRCLSPDALREQDGSSTLLPLITQSTAIAPALKTTSKTAREKTAPSDSGGQSDAASSRILPHPSDRERIIRTYHEKVGCHRGRDTIVQWIRQYFDCKEAGVFWFYFRNAQCGFAASFSQQMSVSLVFTTFSRQNNCVLCALCFVLCSSTFRSLIFALSTGDNLWSDVHTFCRSCEQCQVKNLSSAPASPTLTTRRLEKAEFAFFDLDEQFHYDGYNALLHFIDCHTKFAFVFPCRNKLSTSVLQATLELMQKGFVWQELQTVRTKDFTDHELPSFTSALQQRARDHGFRTSTGEELVIGKHVRISVRSPHVNGHVGQVRGQKRVIFFLLVVLTNVGGV